MATLPLVTTDLVRRLARAEAECRAARAGVVQAEPGNPLGIEQAWHGEAMYLSCSRLPVEWWFNELMGAGPEHEAELPALLDRFTARGIPPRVQVLPGCFTPAMIRLLADRGLRPNGWESLLYRAAGEVDATPPDGVTVQRVGPEPDAVFGEVFAEGFGLLVEPGLGAGARQLCAAQAALPGWQAYLAWCDGEPAAAAVLYLTGGLGYLAAGATLPRFRRRGLQTALIRRRIADATAAGCELLCVETSFDTGSQHNQEREGFRLAALYSTWEVPRDQR